MNVTDCYRVLGLKSGASFEEIKSSYRRLARQCHPDVSGADQRTNDQFIELTTAYKFLLNTLTDPGLGRRRERREYGRHPTSPVSSTSSTRPTPSASPSADERVAPRPVPIQTNPALSRAENELKASTYQQLQQLLKTQRFPRAIALVEGLARRIPQDTEVTQWQAIVYQQQGRHLLREHQPDKARLYLKKALRTDPHNRSLWAEVEKDFRSLEQLC